MNDEHLPVPGTIVLGPTDDEDIWELTFKDEQGGKDVQILLPKEQLDEMDAEFTGVTHDE